MRSQRIRRDWATEHKLKETNQVGPNPVSCPYMKRLGHRKGTGDACTQRRGQVGKVAICEPRGEDSGETKPDNTLILNL